ncbi:MAG: DUF3823 domain-containing protein [Prolixibacteraceae bacterium]|jgi:hypothetical protein
MKLQVIISLIIVLALSSCLDDIDNYDAPDSTITGVVIDNTTNEGVQTEQPNGFRIRLIESGYDNVVPLDFWGKPDGSFYNSQLFANTYEVGPIEGIAVKLIFIFLIMSILHDFLPHPFDRQGLIL